MGDLHAWVSDKLMSVLGFSKPVVVEFVISLSNNALSPSEIVKQLLELGASPSDETCEFANEIFAGVGRKTAPDLDLDEQREREAALLAREQKTYTILEGDDDGGDLVTKIRTRNYRKRKQFEDCEDDEVEIATRGNDVDDGSELGELLRDQKEREELEIRIRERGAMRTAKISDREAIRRSNCEIETLRKVSRQEYMKKRVQKKLVEFRDDIIDEEYIFEDVKLSAAEQKEIRRKCEIYNAVKKMEEVVDYETEFRIPEAYDQKGCVDQGKRFAVALKSSRDGGGEGKKMQVSEKEAWEEHQIGRGVFKFGSKGKVEKHDDYEFVFDDLENAAAMDCGDVEQEFSEESVAKVAFEKVKIERETLPIYTYRDQLLELINDNQVLVIVGETGCGKTTQLPQYLHKAGYTKQGKVACTQPRRVAAMSVAARVSLEMGVKLGHEVGYAIRFEDCTSEKTVLKYMTDGVLLREFLTNPTLEGYSVIMVDEAHERTVSTEILFGLVKDLARCRPDLKLLISSATLDAEKFSGYFDNAPIFRVPGRKFPVQTFYVTAPVPDYLDAALVTALKIHVREPPGNGDILVFLTGQEEIEAAQEILELRTRKLGTKIPELIICPIYANLPTELQAKALEPAHKGARKVVLATNIAETSLTIDGVKYVIDPGYAKISTYSPRKGTESLRVTPISKASADQRAGQSGRTSPGKCFRLYTEEIYCGFEDNTMPEIQRTNLSNVVLLLKSLGIEDVVKFDFMDPPPLEVVIKSLEDLYALGALNKNGHLTKVGRTMSEFPLDPMLSKMIVASDEYKCSSEIISIAALLSVGNSIFYRPKDKQVYADNARKNFHLGNVGDHIALLRVYNSWKENDFSTQWCYENFIQVRSMKRARDIQDQLEGLLERVGIELASEPYDFDVIKKAITSGYFLHSARGHGHEAYSTVKDHRTVHIHPSSGLAEVLPKFVIYHELVETSKEYMWQVTEVQPKWLLEISPHYYQQKDVEDPRLKKMPRVVGRAFMD